MLRKAPNLADTIDLLCAMDGDCNAHDNFTAYCAWSTAWQAVAVATEYEAIMWGLLCIAGNAARDLESAEAPISEYHKGQR